MNRDIKIKGLNGQKVLLRDVGGMNQGTDVYDTFVAAGFEDEEGEGLNLGAYVNREKFLRKIAKFFNVVIYDVGYVEDVVGDVLTDTVEFTQTDVGYHRYTEED